MRIGSSLTLPVYSSSESNSIRDGIYVIVVLKVVPANEDDDECPQIEA
jgi:hypothetical protein